MKAQELIVSCFYNDEGESIQDLIYSSFVAFLKRELGKFASAPDHLVKFSKDKFGEFPRKEGE